MLIGVVSDTHGHVDYTRQAVRMLESMDVQRVIHCGDIGSEAVLLELAGVFGDAGIPVDAVLGNVDLWDEAILHFPDGAGIELHGAFADLSVLRG